jgi:excisionase family DNA binding protein
MAQAIPRHNEPLTISSKTAQELSGLSRATVSRAIASGELIVTHVGSRTLIRFDSFRRWLGLDADHAA